jgi:hypothetical protein
VCAYAIFAYGFMLPCIHKDRDNIREGCYRTVLPHLFQFCGS